MTEPKWGYLDQKDWIALAQVRAGKSEAEGLRATAALLVSRIADGSLRVPISQCHILETWNTGDADRRRDVASALVVLSRRAAIAPLHRIWVQELDTFFSRHFGADTSGPPRPFGTGLGFALGFDDDETKGLMPADAGPADAALVEVMALAEPGRHGLSAAELERRTGWDRWATAANSAIKELLIDRDKYDEHDRFAAITLSMVGREPLDRAIAADVADQFLDHLHDPGPWATLQEVPSLAVMAELHRLRYAKADKEWNRHDYHDLRFLSVALAYCDGVCADAFWADLARRSEYVRERGVVIASGYDAVAQLLDAT